MNTYRKALSLLKLQHSLIRGASLLYVPVRCVHQRGYNAFYDDYSYKFHETNMALMNCKETDQFIYIFKRYGEHMTDAQKSYAFWFIGMN